MKMLAGYDETETAHQDYPVASQRSSQITALFEIDNQQIGITKFLFDFPHRDLGAMCAAV